MWSGEWLETGKNGSRSNEETVSELREIKVTSYRRGMVRNGHQEHICYKGWTESVPRRRELSIVSTAAEMSQKVRIEQ